MERNVNSEGNCKAITLVTNGDEESRLFSASNEPNAGILAFRECREGQIPCSLLLHDQVFELKVTESWGWWKPDMSKCN